MLWKLSELYSIHWAISCSEDTVVLVITPWDNDKYHVVSYDIEISSPISPSSTKPLPADNESLISKGISFTSESCDKVICDTSQQLYITDPCIVQIPNSLTNVKKMSDFYRNFAWDVSRWMLGVGWCLYLSWKSTQWVDFQLKYSHQLRVYLIGFPFFNVFV